MVTHICEWVRTLCRTRSSFTLPAIPLSLGQLEAYKPPSDSLSSLAAGWSPSHNFSLPPTVPQKNITALKYQLGSISPTLAKIRNKFNIMVLHKPGLSLMPYLHGLFWISRAALRAVCNTEKRPLHCN